MNAWRAWYATSRTTWVVYSSAETAWRLLPGEGMIGVVVYLSTVVTPFRQIADGGDWYWPEGGRVRASETMWDGFVDPPSGVESSLLKRSGRLADEAWAEVRAEMMAAREAP